MRTYTLKSGQVKKDWVVIDAKDLILGRLSAVIASHLRGKHRPDFTPHVDCGDNVVVINAEKVCVTGNKLESNVFYWHTGYPGGIKGQSIKERLTGKHPERVIQKAVERMLPKGPLGRKMCKNLRIYCGENHPHEAQCPKVLNVAEFNSKNVKRG